MELSVCVGCARPVIELEGQFDKLDSYLLGEGGPPRASAGYWHRSCLRASDVGSAWQAARLRNYVDVRRFERIAEPPGWVVIRDPRGGKLLALGASGELVDLTILRGKRAREVVGGVVLARVDDEFHLELDDEAAVATMQHTLERTSAYPLSGLLAALGIADRVADSVALEGATFRFDKSQRSLWARRWTSARLEYGVFVPHVLASLAREGTQDTPSIAAIVADPDDEQARVAYARAIAATDPTRAEFIEIQIQLARWRKERVRPADWDKLLSRQYALSTPEHCARWAGDVHGRVHRYAFFRGFVEEVTLSAAQFLATASDLYRRVPILHLTLTDARAVAAELFASPYLSRIQSLSLERNALGDAEVTMLARSPRLANLTWLDLGWNQIGRVGLEALAASQLQPKLRYVGFDENAIPDPTPRFADEYDSDSPVARELQAKYGPRPWLSVTGHGHWPPPRDAA